MLRRPARVILGWSAKVTENGSLDFLDFLHKNSTKIEKKTDRARFSKKNLILAIFDFLGSKHPKIKVFATLRENGSNDFAHFAYLDRSHRYLQLFYWHQPRENSFRPSKMRFSGFRCTFHPIFRESSKIIIFPVIGFLRFLAQS